MDRKSFTGLVLIGAVLLIWSQFFTPKPTNVDEKEVTSEETSDDRGERRTDEVVERKDETPAPSVMDKNNLLTKEDSIRYEEQVKNLSQKHGIFTPSVAESHGGKAKKIVMENEKIIAHINPTISNHKEVQSMCLEKIKMS